MRSWLAQYHYRGFHGAVGENVQYLIRDRGGAELAVMVFGAAACLSTPMGDGEIDLIGATFERFLDEKIGEFAELTP